MYTVRYRPWTGPETTARTVSPFRAAWPDTLNLLGRELDHLDGRGVVLGLDCRPGDVRRDGMLRAGARVDHPGVHLTFLSRHGPLSYATDVFEERYGYGKDWQPNVRAIALALQALRAVDRYGVTRTGEQYRGWRELPTGSSTCDAAMTVDAAARFLAAHADPTTRVRDLPGVLLAGRMVEATYRTAAKQLHPDRGGDTATFQRLQDAKRILDDHHGGRS